MLQQPINVRLRAIDGALRKQPPLKGVVLEPGKGASGLTGLGFRRITIGIAVGIASALPCCAAELDLSVVPVPVVKEAEAEAAVEEAAS